MQKNQISEAEVVEELLVLAKRVSRIFGISVCSCSKEYVCLGCAARAALRNANIDFDVEDLKKAG